MRILVTGGVGFIGSNLVFHLIQTRHDDVLVIDDLSSGSISNLHPHADFRTLDILDPSLGEVVEGFHPDVVVHLAAQTDISASLKDPAFDHRVNVDGTRSVAEAAVRAGARRVVFASSAAVYSDTSELPVTESAEKRPANPYGRSKLEAESVLEQVLAPAGVDLAVLRFSNVYGPRQDWHGEGGAVATFSASVVRDERPTIFGTGEQTRDFIFVADVVSAIDTAARHDGVLAGEWPDGSAYNISTGDETSVQEVYRGIAEAAAFPMPAKYAAGREGEVERSALDPAKARDILGWEAKAAMRDALSITVGWFARNQ